MGSTDGLTWKVEQRYIGFFVFQCGRQENSRVLVGHVLKGTFIITMPYNPKRILKNIVRRFGIDIVRADNPADTFHADWYLRLTARRLEHLASLRIPIANMTVLEVGAGIGDQSTYYIDRGNRITITDARPKSIEYLKKHFPEYDIQYLDMDSPLPISSSPFDVVHCYGLLYHLSRPKDALKFLSGCCKRMLFLETCVSFGNEKSINFVTEDKSIHIYAISGTGCRPTRRWVFETLQELFEYVYVPKTQPNHEQFPTNWTDSSKHQHSLSRAIFVATHEKIDNELLSPSLISHQQRHE